MSLLLTTERLLIREIDTVDGPFILELLNDSEFKKNIGDRGVRSVNDAEKYITEKFISSYLKFGFGFYLVELKELHTVVGICGLAKRDFLADVDIGYAFLKAYRRRGYALESSRAFVEYARTVLKLNRLAAITLPSNNDSIYLLEKLGMSLQGQVKSTPDGLENNLYSMPL